ncbi:T9SS type A sorting domain-containing protein [Aquimarina sp. W85]|uniref:T9SS type A sorting domain-containing protein n=1 Tax=Aquimarina rhodophyticola TaxID=3342246 RepID=UPI00366FB4CC
MKPQLQPKKTSRNRGKRMLGIVFPDILNSTKKEWSLFFFLIFIFFNSFGYDITDLNDYNNYQCDDIEAPRIVCLDPFLIDYPLPEISSDTDLFEFLDLIPTATDNVDGVVEVTQVGEDQIRQLEGQCEGNFAIRRRYRATDSCGNFSACVQIIRVRDLTNPEITCPENLTIEAGDFEFPDPSISGGMATAIDNLSTPEEIVITFEDTRQEVDGECSNNYNVRRVWSATDTCGNTTTCNQIIRVRDRTEPEITCPDNLTVEAGDFEFPDPSISGGTATAIDGVTAPENITITFEDTRQEIDNSCSGQYNVRRVWSATDACGNVATCNQIIRIRDRTEPEIICPENITVQGDPTVSPDPDVTGIAIATDIGDDSTTLELIFTDSEPIEIDTNIFTITRSWTATDSCGNSSNCDQIITIERGANLELECPDDITLEAGSEIDPSITGQPTTNAVEVLFVDEIIEGECLGKFLINRTFTATDAAGNSLTCLQTITVEDTTAPKITCPENITVQGDPTITPSPEVTGTATATDNFDNPEALVIEFIDSEPIEIDTNIFTITRSWTATDSCENCSEICEQIITIESGPDLELECPESITVEAGTTIDPSVTGEPTTNADTFTFVDEIIEGNCLGDSIINRTFTVTDAEGNSLTCVQIITVEDTTVPEIVCPEAITVQGDPTITPSPEVTGTATATDIVDGQDTLNISFEDAMPTETSPNVFSLTRTWTATDSCGNSISCDQVITIESGADLELECPESITVEAGTTIDPSVTGEPTTNADTFTFVDEIIEGNCLGNFVINRTFTVTDAEGNSLTCVQIITVEDTTVPEIVCPEAITVQEDPTITPSPEVTGTATATDIVDGQDTLNISFEDAMPTETSPNVFSLTRTWTATDSCGNSISCDQVITIESGAVLELECPESITVEAGTTIDPLVTGEPTTNADTFTFVDEIIEGNCLGDSIINRTFTVTDAAGNSLTCVQTITVEDTTAPEIVCPEAITVQGDSTITPSPEVTGTATATDIVDGQDTLNISFEDAMPTETSPNVFSLTRTWTATDSCGNSISCDQVITIESGADLELECPESVTVEAGTTIDPSVTGEPTTNANTFTFVDEIIEGNCLGDSIINRTFTVTDAAGNSLTCVQTITVEDTTAPVIFCPQTITFQLSENVDIQDLSITGNPIVSDNSGTDLEITFTDRVNELDCGSANIRRRFTVTDACGNSSNCLQLIQIRDNSGPIITCPDNVTIPNGVDIDISVETLGSATATDSSGIDPTIEFEDTRIELDEDGDCGNYNIRRVWTATNECGATTRCAQIIRVRQVAPELNCPPSSTLEDGPNLDTSVDNLGTATTTNATDVITFVDTRVDLDDAGCNNYNIRRVWTAVNATCNLSTTCVQVIRVRDTSPPNIVCPINVNLTWTEDLNTNPEITGQATAFDNRDAAPIITFEDIIQDVNGDDECGNFNIRRRWSATDACGRTSRCVQVIRVRDIEQNCDSNGFSTNIAANEVTLVQSRKLELSHSAFPNPFKNSTSIDFAISQDTDLAMIEIFSAQGVLVTSVYKGNLKSDTSYQIPFDASEMPAGLYLYRITINNRVETGKLIHIK